jgi:hypothetical protein
MDDGAQGGATQSAYSVLFPLLTDVTQLFNRLPVPTGGTPVFKITAVGKKQTESRPTAPSEASLPEIPIPFARTGKYTHFVGCEYLSTAFDIVDNPEAWLVPGGAGAFALQYGVGWFGAAAPYTFGAIGLVTAESRMLSIRKACSEKIY